MMAGISQGKRSLVVLRRLFELVLHLQAWLKDHCLSGRDRDYLAGARISAGAALSLLYLENAEVTQFNLFASDQCINDAIKGLLHYLLHIYLLEVCVVRYL